MTDVPSSSEGLIAVGAAVVTLVGTFFAWAQGDKEGGRVRDNVSAAVATQGMVSIQTQQTLIHYLEEIITRLDRLNDNVRDRHNEDLKDEFREQTNRLLSQLKDKVDENGRGWRETIRDEGGKKE